MKMVRAISPPPAEQSPASSPCSSRGSSPPLKRGRMDVDVDVEEEEEDDVY